MPSSAAVYGAPPADLAPHDVSWAQTSPLVPGATLIEELSPTSLTSFTVLAPPGTIERRYTLALALRALAPGGTLVALARKDKGGARLGKELRGLGLEPEEDSRAHHRICTGRRPAALGPAVEEAINEGAPRFLAATQLHTQPGVFSWDRPDAGSVLLAAALPLLAGRGADLGGGLGFLTRAALKSREVKTVDLYELDHRAVRLARQNLPESRTRVHWVDVRAGLPATRPFDFVLMNPPFHVAGHEDQSLGLAFLARAAEILRPGGSCWLVANRHLPYEASLNELFSAVRLAHEGGGYKIYEATR